MQTAWNIGNTTVRNPKRIESALKVFVDEGFSGNADSKKDQARLIEKLIERGEVAYEGKIRKIDGRKWRAAFYQLGFISNKSYKIDKEPISIKEVFETIDHPVVDKPYQLTQAGQNLLDSIGFIPEIEDVYIRQFTCYELPSALERNFADGKMKPFILLLQVLNGLYARGEAGINKLETELFLQKFRDHDEKLPDTIIEEIIKFREDVKDLNPREKNEVIDEYLDHFYTDIGMSLNSRSIQAYADTTFRYFSLSGLFTRNGNRLVIRPGKEDYVNKVLDSEPFFNYDQNPVSYFEKYYKNEYPLPTDKKKFALKEIEYLRDRIEDEEHALFSVANNISEEDTFSEIRELRFKLIEYNNWEREQDYANTQREKNQIEDILKYLRKLNGESVKDSPEIDDRPAFLEWAVWRSFLAINEIKSPIHETRRFPIDQDFLPRNTAPGGGSDLIFEFDNYVLVVEVTLTTSNRQMAVESEPVRRHTVGYKEQYPEKDVYCLFVAPSVDNNVVETFRIGVWYKEDKEEFVNIIPFNLSDFISTIELLFDEGYSNLDYRNLLDRCLISRNVRAPQWKSSIRDEINVWKSKFSG